MADAPTHVSIPGPGLKLVPYKRTIDDRLHFVYGGVIPYDAGGTWGIAIDEKDGMPVLRRVHAANVGDEPRTEYFKVEKS